MKILFGIQATGNGHVCRSKEIVKRLKALGHKIQVIFSGGNLSLKQDLSIFTPYQVLKGLTFTTHRGKVSYINTLKSFRFVRFYRDISVFDAAGYDLVITDFEPITARVAKKHNIPSIGIGHQYAFLYDIPISFTDPITYWIMNHFAPVHYPLGLHWHHFDQPILPPILPDHIRRKVGTIPKKILVYLPFECQNDIQRLLRPFQDYRFYVYGCGDEHADQGHLQFRPPSRIGFLDDLLDCSGVISNAGFELPSEALHLGKKLLVKPLHRQLEQISNAAAIEELDLGTVMYRFDPETVSKWLIGPSPPAQSYSDVAKMIAAFIDGGVWSDIPALIRQAWREEG
jgi:uncharacterized protein (TIGR00661 family)